MMSKTLSLFQAGYPQVSMFPVFPNPNGIHLVHHDNLRAGLQSMPKYPALQIKVWHWHQIAGCIYHIIILYSGRTYEPFLGKIEEKYASTYILHPFYK